MQLIANITLLLAIAFNNGEYLESHFEFVGHIPTPVHADSASKEMTVSHCFSSCIQNSNCYYFDFCVNSITENCYQYNKNKSSTSEAVGGPCGRYKLVFQQRRDGSVDFYRIWTEYSDGFGALDTEFYLGNLALHEIIKDKNFELRVELTDQAGEYRYAKYSQFSVGSPDSLYTLTVTGYTGNATNSLSGHNGFNFSTYDMDPENYADVGCATMWHSGWWHAHCGISNLNGLYGSVGIKGLTWYHWKGSFFHVMKSTRMMMRLKEQ
ncbi:ficolin-1-A-like [Saccostrea cucullata]|uniref:ficolin-1-A-like n=1 Tax=Saccostrea cuccullata TaxID=36930 RepID=UPI002ED3647C